MPREWVLARTKPRQEDYAAENIKRQNHDWLLPKFYNAEKRRIEILFQSYIFVGIDDGRWQWLDNTYGISQVVHVGESLARVPAAAIARMLANVDHRGLVVVDQRPTFSTGDRVRITDGSFSGQHGTYDDLPLYADQPPGTRVEILLAWCSASIDLAHIERVEATAFSGGRRSIR